ncbi:ABC transporter permease [Paenibacillus sp. 1001270B_150601_E10]|uniref:ABC transporter permease n=1 Tax=Paenibacillus sp. 1001270B_150601_E10 TaxID=2787079 RepID=UPI00189E756A|nr:ABC transporter permease [Paenibacillus sp. 1001270B_150601_E10]
MYILQNALKNLVRNKGRNLMIGAIIFVIILTTVVSLIINNTSSAVIEDYKERFASEVYITPDMQKVMEEAQKNSTDGRVMIKKPEIPSEQLLQFAHSEYLKQSIATGTISANNPDIQAIDQDDNDTSSSGAGITSIGGQGGMMKDPGMNGNYKLMGDSWEDFNEGLRSLESGRLPEADGESVISDELRDLNNISLGDVITFTANMSVDAPSDVNSDNVQEGDKVTVDGIEYTASISGLGTVRLQREVTYPLTVVGVYNDLTDEYANDNMPKSAGFNRRNEVLTTLNTLIAQRKADETGVNVNVTYYLKSPEMLAPFEAEVRAKGLSDLFNVNTDTASYEKIVRPVEGLKSISITFMVVVIILGSIILLLLASISIRERKYEIGVLRAMGMKKAKVALGLCFEILIITCFCLVIGLGVGTVAAQPVSDMLLQNQADAAQSSTSQGADGGNMMMGSRGMQLGGAQLGGTQTNAKPLSEMEIALDLVTILQIIAISILLASFAGLVSISNITKYEPIKILMERN